MPNNSNQLRLFCLAVLPAQGQQRQAMKCQHRQATKYAGQACQGVFMVITNRAALRPVRVGLEIASALFALFGEKYQLENTDLLLGSLFLAIGSMASTVREVQTLSMPVSMFQLMVFFFASYALTSPGTWVEWVSILFPVSSPYAMLARAAQDAQIWPHVLALAWQGVRGGETRSDATAASLAQRPPRGGDRIRLRGEGQCKSRRSEQRMQRAAAAGKLFRHGRQSRGSQPPCSWVSSSEIAKPSPVPPVVPFGPG